MIHRLAEGAHNPNLTRAKITLPNLPAILSPVWMPHSQLEVVDTLEQVLSRLRILSSASERRQETLSGPKGSEAKGMLTDIIEWADDARGMGRRRQGKVLRREWSSGQN